MYQHNSLDAMLKKFWGESLIYLLFFCRIKKKIFFPAIYFFFVCGLTPHRLPLLHTLIGDTGESPVQIGNKVKVGRQADGVLAEVNWPLGLSEQAGTGSGARCTRCRGAGEQLGGSRLASLWHPVQRITYIEIKSIRQCI